MLCVELISKLLLLRSELVGKAMLAGSELVAELLLLDTLLIPTSALIRLERIAELLLLDTLLISTGGLGLPPRTGFALVVGRSTGPHRQNALGSCAPTRPR